MVGYVKLNNHEMNSMASIVCLVFLFQWHSLCALVNKEVTDEAEIAAVIISVFVLKNETSSGMPSWFRT